MRNWRSHLVIAASIGCGSLLETMAVGLGAERSMASAGVPIHAHASFGVGLAVAATLNAWAWRAVRSGRETPGGWFLGLGCIVPGELIWFGYRERHRAPADRSFGKIAIGIAIAEALWLLVAGVAIVGGSLNAAGSQPASTFVRICSAAKESMSSGAEFQAGNYFAREVWNDLGAQAEKLSNGQGVPIGTSNLADQLRAVVAESFDSGSLRVKSCRGGADSATLVCTQLRSGEVEEARIRMVKEGGAWKIAAWRIGRSGLGRM